MTILKSKKRGVGEAGVAIETRVGKNTDDRESYSMIQTRANCVPFASTKKRYGLGKKGYKVMGTNFNDCNLLRAAVWKAMVFRFACCL